MLAGAEGQGMWSLSDGDGVGPNDGALLVAHQEEEVLLQIGQDWDHSLKGKIQMLGDEGRRHGLSQAGQLTDDKVAHLVVFGGHEGMPGIVTPRRLGEVLFPFMARDLDIVASLTE
jgi:hypothetical protein